MKQIITAFIKYPSWVKVGLLALAILGTTSLRHMQTSFFTPLDPRQIVIQVVYPGASPEEIERGVVQKIEANLQGIIGVDRSTSISQESRAVITLETLKGFDGDAILQDVKNAVNKISSFPDDMEPPIIFRRQIEDFAVAVTLTGPVSLYELKKEAERFEQQLLRVDGISLTEISGYPDREIRITVNPDVLDAYQISFAQLATAIRAENQDVSGGVLKRDADELRIRGYNKTLNVARLRARPIRRLENGQQLLLGDVARVEETWADQPNRYYYNNEPSVVLTVNKSVKEDVLFIADKVAGFVAQFNEKGGVVRAIVSRDRSTVLRQRVALLTKNGILGSILIIVLLSLFLHPRLAIWVALSIPVSFMAMFIVGAQIGLTINVISLFGMIVVIGILVDDGIVIAENIYQHVERGEMPVQAAVKGTLEVLPSIASAISTTIVAFTPFFFLEGQISEILASMAVVVIITLLASIFEGALFLPSHLAHSKALTSPHQRYRFNQWSSAFMARLRDAYYRPVLQWVLRHRAISLGVPVFLLLFTFMCMKMGVIRFTFFPFIDADTISISLEMPSGTRDHVTLKTLNKIETHVKAVNADFSAKRQDGLPVIESISKQVLASPENGRMTIQLLDGETRNLESFYITQAIRERTGRLPEAKNFSIGSRSFFGKPVSISLLGYDLRQLREAKDRIKAFLTDFDKVRDVVDLDAAGPPEIHLSLTAQGKSLGFTFSDLMRQVRNGLFGLETQRIQRGVDEVKLWLRYPESALDSLPDLKAIQVESPAGVRLPLSVVANVEIGRGRKSISHVNGMREVRVESDLANQKDPVPPILATITKEALDPILADYPDVYVGFEGQKRQTDKTSKSARQVMPIIFLVMFGLVVVGFRSFAQAGVVFLLLPFAFVGVAWGHVLHGMTINILSIYGIIALIGIVLNDAIILTNSMNYRLKDGMAFSDALFEAAVSRFRPIVLTSLTTIFGLGPLILEKSRQAQFLIPMAISVAYGLLFATIIILFVLPIYLSLVNDVKRKVLGLVLPEISPESVEPAVQEKEWLHDFS